ncbi:MAG: hypothetical protein WAR59_03455 [Ignavibacteriaceae bacterium]
MLISCDNNSPTVPKLENPEDTTYNISYEDSILFFSSNPPQQLNTLCIGHINGTGIRSLTSNIVAHNATWAPNKRKLLFIGSPIGASNWGIYQIEVCDYKVKLIPTEETNCESAAYSPDMKYIVYSLYHSTNSSTLKLYNVKTKVITILLENIPGYFSTLSWSTDSKKVLLHEGVTINIETKELERLFQYGHAVNSPKWSPDGSKVLFSSGTPQSSSNIIVYDLVTNEFHPVYETEDLQNDASWSKDNSQIIFSMSPSSSLDTSYISKVNIDGTDYQRITNTTFNTSGPCWYR